MENKQIVINSKSVIYGFLVILIAVSGILALWLLKDIVIYLFIALIIALMLEPFVDWFVKKKIPRSLSVLVVMGLFLFIIGGLSSVAIVPLTIQVQSLVINFPSYIDYLLSISGVQDSAEITNTIAGQFSQTSGSIISATMGVFSGFLSILVTIVFTLYIMFDLHNLRRKLIEILPISLQEEVKLLIVSIEKKLGGWLRGQVVLMLLIGITTYIGLLILNVPYALALAVIAGLLEIVPVIGPILGSIPAIIIGFTQDPITGVGTLFLYLVVQQLENNLIVPKIMQKAVGFDPLVTIIALMIGSNLYGITGALISIPVTIILYESYKTILRYNQNNKKAN